MTDPKLWSFLGVNAEHSLLEAMNEQDRAALDVFAALCGLYKIVSSLDQRDVLAAMSLASSCMQTGTRRVCRWAIAYALDWNDVDRVWKLVEGATKPKWIVVDGEGQPATVATAERLSKRRRRRT